MSKSLTICSSLLLFFIGSFLSFAYANSNLGAKSCAECHEPEYDVWKTTPHFKSFRSVHKKDEAKKVMDALGGGKMKNNKTCALCHYTQIGGQAKSGPSCESCHGSASRWNDIHNDFGGPDLGAEDEVPAHKATRLQQSTAAGMISSGMSYRISANCMQCHGLSNSKLSNGDLNKMLEAGHPIEPDFEVVSYSQGALRHRFRPTNPDVNAKLDSAGMARLYLGGQAAVLVASTKVKSNSQNAKFQEAINARIARAQKALGAVKSSVPQAGALLSSPSHAAALAFERAIADKDLSSAVSGMIPANHKLKYK